MKLQLFINGEFFSERLIYDFDLTFACTKSRNKIEERKNKLDSFIEKFKKDHILEIHGADNYQIMFVIESKMNKQKILRPEKVVVIKKEIEAPVVKMIRPKAEYSNNGYLKMLR